MSLPDGVAPFIERAGWSDAAVEPLPGDASFRRYFRLRRAGGETAMLMHAPPPHEDPKPFLHVSDYLARHGLRAPETLAANPDEGLVLLEDFGDERLADRLAEDDSEEEALYAGAIDALVALHRQPPGDFAPYDLATYMREVELFTEWYCPLAGLEVDGAAHADAWIRALSDLPDRQSPGVTVLRDYHAENIMLTPAGEQGLIDFQDALVGHPAYDLVSLLQDARRDVDPGLEAVMLDRYRTAMQPDDRFLADYALLGAQRNAKIVGIFARLAERDGKPKYLSLIPRVWDLLERDLKHPILTPVADWFAANIPAEVRQAGGGIAA